jgi:hypothetical protein
MIFTERRILLIVIVFIILTFFYDSYRLQGRSSSKSTNSNDSNSKRVGFSINECYNYSSLINKNQQLHSIECDKMKLLLSDATLLGLFVDCDCEFTFFCFAVVI